MREAGADIKATSEMMGHDSIMITLKTYTDASRDFKSKRLII
jgi:site-specific recombinase XerD